MSDGFDLNLVSNLVVGVLKPVDIFLQNIDDNLSVRDVPLVGEVVTGPDFGANRWDAEGSKDPVALLARGVVVKSFPGIA